MSWLESRGIGARPFLTGNLMHEPAYLNVRQRNVGTMPVADEVARRTFWIGVHPGITDEMTAYIAETIREFVGTKRATNRALALR